MKADILLWLIWGSNLCLKERRADLDASRQSWGIQAPVATAAVAQLLELLLSKILLWINGHTVTLSLLFVCHKSCIHILNPRHILDAYMRLSRILATVYPFVCYSHCIPLQKQKVVSLCQFPKGAKKSNHSCWMNLFSKGQGDSVQRGTMCNSRFPRLNSCRLKVDCPAQCKRIYKSWKEHWRTCSRLWRNVKSNCRWVLYK